MGVRFTRRLRALAGREPSQECFAPKAASPRIGGELRLPFAAEQTPLGWGWGLFWDGTAGNAGGSGCRPPSRIAGHTSPRPPDLSVASLLLCGSGGVAQDSDWGRGWHRVAGEVQCFQAWAGEGEGRAY